MPGAKSNKTLKFSHRNNIGNIFAVWTGSGSVSRFQNMFPLKPGVNVIVCCFNKVSIFPECREKAGGRIIIKNKKRKAAKAIGRPCFASRPNNSWICQAPKSANWLTICGACTHLNHSKSNIRRNITCIYGHKICPQCQSNLTMITVLTHVIRYMLWWIVVFSIFLWKCQYCLCREVPWVARSTIQGPRS